MFDLKVLNAKVLLTINGISPVRGLLNPAVLLTGQDFNNTDSVVYNGVPALDFIIYSSTKLIVKVPTSQIGKDIVGMEVYSSVPLPNLDATLVFELTAPLKKLSGIERLVQSWMILFNTTPGTDIFSPTIGGGVRSILGRPVNGNSAASADLALAIDKTKKDLVKLQTQDPTIPPEEKLLSADLGEVAYDPSTGVLGAKVTLTNMLGDVGQLSIG